MIITIDGPVASGKSTIAHLLAYRNNYFHLSSGLLYRTCAFLVHAQGYTDASCETIVSCCLAADIQYENDEQRRPLICLNGRVVFQGDLESDLISDVASRISQFPELRQHVLMLQRTIAQGKSVVIDGRDCGIVVFPEAKLKFFLTASPEVRAKRLCQREHSDEKVLADCLERVVARDTRDAGRIHSPMRPASDAIIVDTSSWTIEQTIMFIQEQLTRNQ